jgi:hypothetical protein
VEATSQYGRNVCRERKSLKRKPDVVLMLTAAFVVGVLVTLLLPLTANNSVAEPASELQAGVLFTE